MVSRYFYVYLFVVSSLFGILDMNGQSGMKTSSETFRYYIMIDSTNSNFEVRYIKKCHPSEISLKVERADMDSFKIQYDPLNTTGIFPNGHAHFYVKKNSEAKFIDLQWLMNKEIRDKIHNGDQLEIFFVEEIEDEKFWSVYEAGIVFEMD